MLYKKYSVEKRETLKIYKNCCQQLSKKSQTSLILRKIKIYILVLAIVCVSTVTIGCLNGREAPISIVTGLPREIEKIVFEEWDGEITTEVFATEAFARPIYKSVSEGRVGGYYLAWGLENFLVKNNYAKLEIETVEDLSGPIETKYMYFNESIEPYILRSYGDTSYLLLASRKLRRIDFKNEYEQLGEKFYAIKFTYTLEEELPGLPDIEKEFQGKAELYWDPSEGAWTLQYIYLEDSYLDYINVLDEIYGE